MTTPANYSGLHARYYDAVYWDKPYREEALFVDALLEEAGVRRGRLLDIACGTGRHAAAFLELGWSVTGVDISDALLEQARANAPGAFFHRQDMCKLDIAGEPFDAVTCLFDSIGYPIADAAVLAALKAAGRHLATQGALVIEFLHARALLRDASPVRVRRVEPSSHGDELIRISTTAVDPHRRVIDVDFDLIQLRADGTYGRWQERQTNRFFDVGEMQTLLKKAGLRPERALPAYRDGEIDESTFHVIALARAGA